MFQNWAQASGPDPSTLQWYFYLYQFHLNYFFFCTRSKQKKNNEEHRCINSKTENFINALTAYKFNPETVVF